MSAKVNAKEYAGGAVARYLLLGSVLLLTTLGLVMIYSASSISALVKEGSSAHYLLKQGVGVFVGVAAAFFLARFDYRRFRGSLARYAWGTSIALLVLTILLGVVRGGARRWIPLGIFNLQPSELAKIACVLLAASVIVDWQRGKSDTRALLTQVGAITVLPAVFIMFQPDLGTTLSLVVAIAFVLFLGGLDSKWIAAAIGLVLLLATVGIALEPYRLKRVFAFLDPWADAQGKGYQTVQALMAFGTGGLDGVGLGLSRQKWFYLPEAHTDFIFAMVGEEAGLIGTLLVVVAFAVFLYAGIRIAMGSRDKYGRLVAGGLTGMLVFQAFMNMAAVTAIMPVTGKPLPFLSYGGSSMLVTMVCVGLILSVSEYGARAPREVRVRPRREEPRHASTDKRGRDGRPHLSRSDGGRRVRRRA